jgi:hypothetical protein
MSLSNLGYCRATVSLQVGYSELRGKRLDMHVAVHLALTGLQQLAVPCHAILVCKCSMDACSPSICPNVFMIEHDMHLTVLRLSWLHRIVLRW